MSKTSQADRMLGESASFLQMQEQVSRLALLNKPVLIIGERGTGKELVAARLHYLSPRWDQNFLKINCAAFHESLLESHLFGHETGAFTGAVKQHKGLFERAHEGSLFLDEIATASMTVQEKILRVTEYGELERLGGQQPLTVNVRIIAAANVDLPELAARGQFRSDLLDRLAFDVITLPPLRARREDIPLLAEHFAVNMVKEMDREYFPGFTRAAMAELLAYPWPGNIRELKNVVERCVYRSEDPHAPIETIVFDPFESPYRLAGQGPVPKLSPSVDQNPQPVPQPTPQANEAAVLQAAMANGLKAHLQDYELSLLRQALSHCQYNQKKTAKALGLTYDQLRGFIKKHGL